MNSSAEAIAKVAADLKANRVRNSFGFDRAPEIPMIMQSAVTVDATQVYIDLVERDKPVYLYEDNVLRPVWEQAFLSYVNEHGNVIAMHTHVIDLREKEHSSKLYWESRADTHVIDWSEIRWMYHVFVYIGGRGSTGPFQTTGPVHMWRIAVKDNGEIQDINWIHIAEEYPLTHWDTAQLVLLSTINLGNCVNVEIVEPTRPRAERRRIERTGIRVTELHLRPISRSYRGKGLPPGESGLVPMHSVRGHFATYGPEYGRGLLFGKYAGRFWIPAHARGNPEVGETEQNVTVDVAKEMESFVE